MRLFSNPGALLQITENERERERERGRGGERDIERASKGMRALGRMRGTWVKIQGLGFENYPPANQTKAPGRDPEPPLAEPP